MAHRCLFDLVCPVKAEAMKDDLVSTLEPAEDYTPLGHHSSVLSRGEPGVSLRPAAVIYFLGKLGGQIFKDLWRCCSQPIDSVIHRPGLTPLCLGHPIGAVRS